MGEENPLKTAVINIFRDSLNWFYLYLIQLTTMEMW